MAYAHITNGIVVELFTPPPGVSITACFAPGLIWVDITATPAVVPGYTYDGTAFHAPVAPPAPPNPSTIPSLAFLSRFTTAEVNAIQTAALASPPTANSLALHLYLMQLGAATVVDLTSPLTTGGLAALVAAGLLTAARQVVILTP